MNIISVSSEVAPWSKTGGLGDVCSALPKALAKRGHRVMSVAPRYEAYSQAWNTGVRQTVNGHTLGFFHCEDRGVDRVFIDHPAICRGQIDSSPPISCKKTRSWEQRVTHQMSKILMFTSKSCP